jgi:predicted phage baseplate assembly protein
VSLPAPNLDDRRFQELVDEGKRLVQRRCPEWSDHNVSDPGVTIIEVFAWMTDQLIHRLNQVPDRLYVKFLDLLGIELQVPVAAEADVTFWLSAPQTSPVVVEPGTTQVSTLRTETEQPVTFTVTERLSIVPCSLSHVLSTIQEGSYRSHTDELPFREGFLPFDTVPKPGDALLIGLSTAVPSCAVTLRFDCDVAAGTGVDPLNPPIVWEALDEDGWKACEVQEDETGGLNRPGTTILHVPASHESTVFAEQSAGWLRCRVAELDEGQPPYDASPRILGLTAFTSGGTTRAVNAEVIRDERIGTSNGLPGQRFPLKNRPVVPSDDPGSLVVGGDSEPWLEVDSFIDSGPNDRHFRLDRMAGEVVFGPVVREPGGDVSQYGAVPRANAVIELTAYRTGGGSRGNVGSGSIKILKSAIQYVARVENRKAAGGGVDGEKLDNAKLRGPMQLRGTRAVAARDFEHQARSAAPTEVARVKCLSAGAGADPGAVRVLITPTAISDPLGRLRFDQLTPLRHSLLEKITTHLDRRRLVGVRVLVEPPLYMGLTITATIHCASTRDPRRVQDAALEALYRYFHPITGGPDRAGWPFGRPAHHGEAFWVLQQVPGVLFVERAQLFRSNPLTGQRGDAVDRLELEPNALVFSHEHEVDVVTEAVT